MYKNDIAAEIEAISAKIVDAFNAHDVESLVAFIENSEDLHYVEHTQVTIGWETLKNGFEEWHQANQDLSLTMNQTHVNVLSEDIAVLTADCVVCQSEHKIQKMTWTAVFQKKEDQWKIVNAHEAVSDIDDAN